MAHIKVSVTVEDQGTRQFHGRISDMYRVIRVVNSTDWKIGSFISKDDADEMILRGITVTVVGKRG